MAAAPPCKAPPRCRALHPASSIPKPAGKKPPTVLGDPFAFASGTLRTLPPFFLPLPRGCCFASHRLGAFLHAPTSFVPVVRSSSFPTLPPHRRSTKPLAIQVLRLPAPIRRDGRQQAKVITLAPCLFAHVGGAFASSVLESLA